MIKKYFSKYTGQQIDEAVSALIENNVRIEDLNQEVVDLINSKANEQDLAALQKEIEDNQIKVVEIPIGILQKAANEETLTAEELAFFTSDYKIYKCAVPLEGAEELGLQMYFVTSVITDNTIALSSHLYNVIIDLTTGKVELEASVDLEMVDIKEKVSNLESRTNSLETEVSNISDAASNAESLAYENQTAINELKVSVEDLAGSGESTPTPILEGERVDKIYFNHNLSIDEVKAICDQLTFRLGSACEYTIAQTETIKIAIQGDYNANSPSQVSNYRMFVWSDTQYFEFDPYSGWQTGKNGDGSYEIGEDIVAAGQNNDLLVNLVSITPFTASKGRVGELEAAVEELHNGIGELEEKVETTVQMVTLPIDFITKALVSYSENGKSFDMTDDEAKLFENAYSKIYIGKAEGTDFAVFTPAIQGVLDADSANQLILYGGEWFMLVVDLQTKTAKLSQTINSSDYNYLSKVVTEQSYDIDALETAIGDINSLLDQINGEVM